MMVLREEFFPFMEEVENSVSLMIKGANGNIFQKSTQSSDLHLLVLLVFYTKGFWSLCLFLSLELLDCDDLHSVIRLVLKAGNYMNAVGIFPITIMFS